MKPRLLQFVCFMAGAILAYFVHAAYGGRYYATRHEGMRLDRMTGRLDYERDGLTFVRAEFK